MLDQDQQSVLEYDLTDSEDENGSPNRARMPDLDRESSPKLASSIKKHRGGKLNSHYSASSSKAAQKMVESVAAPLLQRKAMEMIEEDDISFQSSTHQSEL